MWLVMRDISHSCLWDYFQACAPFEQVRQTCTYVFIRVPTCSYVFIRFRVCECDLSHSCVWRYIGACAPIEQVSHTCAFIYLTCHLQMCDLLLLAWLRHLCDSLCVICLLHMCDTTLERACLCAGESYVRQISFICVTHLIHTCHPCLCVWHRTSSHVWHVCDFWHVTCRIHTWDFLRVTCLIHMRDCWRVTCLNHTCHTTFVPMSRCVTCLFHKCDTSHS